MISIEELKDELIAYTFDGDGNTEYKYPDFPIFKRDVLNKSIAEIKKKLKYLLSAFLFLKKKAAK